MCSRDAKSLTVVVLLASSIVLALAPARAAEPDSTRSAAPRPTASAPT